jgi:hypothetical protein
VRSLLYQELILITQSYHHFSISSPESFLTSSIFKTFTPFLSSFFWFFFTTFFTPSSTDFLCSFVTSLLEEASSFFRGFLSTSSSLCFLLFPASFSEFFGLKGFVIYFGFLYFYPCASAYYFFSIKFSKNFLFSWLFIFASSSLTLLNTLNLASPRSFYI